MRFGDYIKDIRRDKGWTQPEAARKVGIEQSYLSKLETGKSYPSEEVFASLLSAYSLDLSEMHDKLFPADLDHLRQIGQVRDTILTSERDQLRRVQSWLIAGIVSLILGGACLGAALLAEKTEVTKYLYKADAVLPETDVAPASTLNPPAKAERSSEHTRDSSSRQQATTGRTLYLAIDDYRDVFFTESVPSGERQWRFYGSRTDIVRSSLRWFMIPAVMLICGGVGCFFASYRTR